MVANTAPPPSILQKLSDSEINEFVQLKEIIRNVSGDKIGSVLDNPPEHMQVLVRRYRKLKKILVLHNLQSIGHKWT